MAGGGDVLEQCILAGKVIATDLAAVALPALALLWLRFWRGSRGGRRGALPFAFGLGPGFPLLLECVS